MSKPAGRCVYCGGGNLTKGHIWPDSYGEFLPSNALYHEQKIGTFNTFESTIPGPAKWERTGTGPLHKRRPRNTCLDCNTGWMSRLEEYALPIIEPLVLNQPQLIDLPGQLALASVLALVSTRIEFTARGMRTIPREELDKIRLGGLPSRNWRVWIARFIGPDLKDYRYNYTAMQIADDPSAAFGAEHCNTQVTTLIIGQLYVHMLFSTVWPNFQGYEGVELTQIWPPAGAYIEARLLPPMDETHGILLHETISRLGKMPGGI